MKILGFAASLRKDSLNRLLLQQAFEILAAKQGLVLDLAEFREFEMPIYDADVEAASGLPKGAKELVRRVRASEAIVIATPEYNGGIPGTLKNALDWVSRDKPIAFDGKPILLLSASTGRLGGVRGLWHTRVPFEAVGGFVYPTMFGLPNAGAAFDAQGALVDLAQKARLAEELEDFVAWARKMS